MNFGKKSARASKNKFDSGPIYHEKYLKTEYITDDIEISSDDVDREDSQNKNSDEENSDKEIFNEES